MSSIPQSANTPQNYRRYANELLDFGWKNARASIFGVLLLGMMLATDDYPLRWIARYDLLFIGAIFIQGLLIFFHLETRRETIAILCFHAVATLMEIYKTSEGIGSWTYPEPCFFKIANVPLFAGFMYSAVGSYLVCAWSIFKLKFNNYPAAGLTLILASLIYLNFFTHHFLPDVRLPLFLASLILFSRTTVSFKVLSSTYRFPFILSMILIAFFIWIAENISTYSNIWLYPHQSYAWKLVPLQKIGAWYLLMIISFVIVNELRKVDYTTITLGLNIGFNKATKSQNPKP
ncbi:MAG: DUF817 domain-containing protein [Saprospiraceae bacterium]